MENNAKKLISSAERLKNGKQLTENYGALKALAESEEVKNLIAKMGEGELSQITQGGGKDAAENLKKLLSSPEGRELVKKVAKATGI